MKKITIFTATLLCGLTGAHICPADISHVEDGEIKPIFKMWGGVYLTDIDSNPNGSLAENLGLPEESRRVGASKAAEWYSLDNSISGGFLYKGHFLPHRIHLEADYYNENDWFGDFRHSYKDLFQIRILPRRFYHNLDNISLYDYNGTEAAIDQKDAGIDDYGLRIDIDKFKLRLKTPDFPMHVFSNAEIVKRKGKQQFRFMGGAAYHSNPTRVSEARDIDQENKEYTLGTNAHLGPVEVEYAYTVRKFDNNESTPTYAYLEAPGRAAGTYEHGVIPDLKAHTNTVKIHTSHTGRIFASATLSQIAKSNEYSGAEASNTMGYGDISWLPMENLSFAAKFRYQSNRSSDRSPNAPAIGIGNLGYTATDVDLNSFQADYGTANLIARYIPMPKLHLKAEYLKEIKEVLTDEAINYRRPEQTTKDTLSMTANWRAMSKVKVKGKLSYRNIHNEFGTSTKNLYDGTEPDALNIDPEHTIRGLVGVTWTPSPKVAAFFSINITREKSDDLHLFATHDSASGEHAEDMDRTMQRYLASVSFLLNDKISLTPSYTFMSSKQDQDIMWEDGFGAEYLDTSYSNDIKAHNLSVNVMFTPSEIWNVGVTLDYTTTDGSYDPSGGTHPFSQNIEKIGDIASTETDEITLRIDAEYDLGNGWGTGLDLQYTDWSDDSFDNPSDGSFYKGLLKITKELSL